MTFRIAAPPPTGADHTEALDRVTEVLPGPSARSRAALALALTRVRDSRLGPAAWGASELTPTGCPVELGVSSARREIRWVAQVGAPEDAPADAPKRAAAVLAALTGSGLPPRTQELVRVLHEGRGLRFGAWVGGRHGDAREAFKLYLEVPDHHALERSDFGALAVAREVIGRTGAVRFLGLPQDGSGAVEVYCRADPRCPDVPELVVGRSGLGLPGGLLRRRLRELDHVASGSAEDPRNLGFSVTATSDRVLAVAIFTFARCLFGDDPTARRQILARAEREGWPSAAVYEGLSRPLSASPAARRLHHGPVSLVATYDGGTETHIGLAPPPAPAGRPTPRELELQHA